MRHVKLFTPFCFTLAALYLGTPLWAQTAQEEWEFLREAAKEVELYLPNRALVNEEAQNGPQNDEIIDEVSTGRAAPMRQRSQVDSPEPSVPTRRFRSR